MNHWIIAPILVPLLAAIALLLLSARGRSSNAPWVSLAATIVQLSIALMLLNQAIDVDYATYSLGNWPAPFGIVLVLDRLSGLMLVLTGLVAGAGLVAALDDRDAYGGQFHTLFQFQLMGLNGAFLTGDLFNLFVFFEVLLIASYGLLLEAGGKERVRAGLHYVVLNLAGSSLFLIALGIIYGVTGTLNMAHLAVTVARVPAADTALLSAGALLLLLVFSLKAAIAPLYFWLPATYSAAAAPVAALFAIMTKVGAYSIVRVFTLDFGELAGALAGVAEAWLLPAGLVTVALGTFGVLASGSLRRLISYLVVVSVGTLLAGIGLFTIRGISGALFYLVHSTLITAALFLLADIVKKQRGVSADLLAPGPLVATPWLVGGLYFAAAVTVAGLPPMSGFIGKALILQASQLNAAWPWLWGVVLVSGLVVVVALSRAGSVLFWKTESEAEQNPGSFPALAPVVALLAMSALLVIAGGPLQRFSTDTAAGLVDPSGYVKAVLLPAQEAQEAHEAHEAQTGEP